MGRVLTGSLIRSWSLTAACLLFSNISVTAQEGAEFRAEAKLVRLLATVRDENGKLMGGLGKTDFTVLDQAQRQTIRLFETQTEQPLSIALLVDTSASTGVESKYKLDAVRRFLKAVLNGGNPEDRVSLYSFNFEVRQLTSFTREYSTLDKRLMGLVSTAGTSLYDAIWFASKDLDTREGRRVIILITDGGDTTSGKNYQAAQRAAQEADTILYPILLVPIKNQAGRNVGGEHALTTMSESTGGQLFRPSVGRELDESFDTILKELRTQYLIGYYPENAASKDGFHRVELRTAKAGLRVSARTGYYDGESRR